MTLDELKNKHKDNMCHNKLYAQINDRESELYDITTAKLNDGDIVYVSRKKYLKIVDFYDLLEYTLDDFDESIGDALYNDDHDEILEVLNNYLSKYFDFEYDCSYKYLKGKFSSM